MIDNKYIKYKKPIDKILYCHTMELCAAIKNNIFCLRCRNLERELSPHLQDQKIWKICKFTTFCGPMRELSSPGTHIAWRPRKDRHLQREMELQALAYLEQALLYAGKESSAKFVAQCRLARENKNQGAIDIMNICIHLQAFLLQWSHWALTKKISKSPEKASLRA